MATNQPLIEIISYNFFPKIKSSDDSKALKPFYLKMIQNIFSLNYKYIISQILKPKFQKNKNEKINCIIAYGQTENEKVKKRKFLKCTRKYCSKKQEINLY